MSLKLMYITNQPDVALVEEKYGVDRIWIDLERLGKEQRQQGINSVKSHHTISDILRIKPLLTKAEMLVRVDPWNDNSMEQIDNVVNAGADIVMLPMWRTPKEVSNFISAVKGRCKTTLLLETKEAEDCLGEVLSNGGMDEIHIGLNDLHLSYGLTFMFELLSNGTVERICDKIRMANLPYGFGGVAKLGSGDLPAERVIMEHYRLGSTRAILSRSFCNTDITSNIDEIENTFKLDMLKLRDYEGSICRSSEDEFEANRRYVCSVVNHIVEQKRTKV